MRAAPAMTPAPLCFRASQPSTAHDRANPAAAPAAVGQIGPPPPAGTVAAPTQRPANAPSTQPLTIPKRTVIALISSLPCVTSGPLRLSRDGSRPLPPALL